MGSDCRYCRGTNGIRLQILWREQLDQVADTVEGPMGSDCRYCRGTNGIRLQVL